MEAQLINDLDDFVGAFDEFISLVGEQMKDQPVMQLNCIAAVLSKQLDDINRRVQELHLAARSDQRAQVESLQ